MSTKEKTKSCPSCEGWMRHEFRETEIEYQGYTLKYSQPGWWCDTCDDGILEGEDNEIHDVALHEVMALAKKSPISPLLIRAIRETVGVSQREAGRLFGGGPTAFYKYETAKAIPSVGMANLLRLALERPDLFTKPKRGEFRQPPVEDVTLLRQAVKDVHLDAIMRRVYPETVAEQR